MSEHRERKRKKNKSIDGQKLQQKSRKSGAAKWSIPRASCGAVPADEATSQQKLAFADFSVPRLATNSTAQIPPPVASFWIQPGDDPANDDAGDDATPLFIFFMKSGR